MEEIDKEISEMKLSVNARARIVAEEFLKNVSCTFSINSDATLFAEVYVFALFFTLGCLSFVW